MLKVITKREYFDYLNTNKSDRKFYTLKNVQDGFINKYFKPNIKNKIIGEIGGGHSRTLERLGVKNTCFNIEKFEGKGNGPEKIEKIKNYELINTYVGEFSGLLKRNYFDYLYSISVLEHVDDSYIENFFKESLSILKTNGISIHAFDAYLSSSKKKNSTLKDRLNLILDKSKMAGLTLIESPKVDIENLRFKSHYASNSDIKLWQWNKSNSSIAKLTKQNVSFTLIQTKK